MDSGKSTLYGSVAPTRKQLAVGPEIRPLPPGLCPPRRDGSDSANSKPQGAVVDIGPHLLQLPSPEPEDGRCFVFCWPVM